jgi:hypothetical protein
VRLILSCVGTSGIVTTARVTSGWTQSSRPRVDRVTVLLGAGIAWMLLLMAGLALLML